MSATRRKYTKEFKIEAVRLFENSDKSGREIERDLGIGIEVLYRWELELQDENLRAFPGHGNLPDEERIRLRKKLAEITEERDILRKAVAIF